MSPSPGRDQDRPHARDHVAHDERRALLVAEAHVPRRVPRRVQHRQRCGDGPLEHDLLPVLEAPRDLGIEHARAVSACAQTGSPSSRESTSAPADVVGVVVRRDDGDRHAARAPASARAHAIHARCSSS